MVFILGGPAELRSGCKYPGFKAMLCADYEALFKGAVAEWGLVQGFGSFPDLARMQVF